MSRKNKVVDSGTRRGVELAVESVRVEAPWGGRFYTEGAERIEAPWHGESLDEGHFAGEPDHSTVMPDKGQSEKPRRAALGLGPTADEVPTRAAVLREAEGLITGDRNKSYGSPTENFTNIAELWNVQFGHKLREGQRFTATDVAAAMIHVKQARLIAQPKRDNFVDIAGYAACGWETQADAETLND